jgi:hypothetical protein
VLTLVAYDAPPARRRLWVVGLQPKKNEDRADRRLKSRDRALPASRPACSDLLGNRNDHSEFLIRREVSGCLKHRPRSSTPRSSANLKLMSLSPVHLPIC